MSCRTYVKKGNSMFRSKTRFFALSMMAILSLWSAIGVAAHPVTPFDSTTGQELTIARMPVASDGSSPSDAVPAATSSSAAAEPLRAAQAESADRIRESHMDESDYVSPSRLNRLVPGNLAPTRYNKTIDRGDGD
jgi:hypothetical protein